jgi:hypothetical protein
MDEYFFLFFDIVALIINVKDFINLIIIMRTILAAMTLFTAIWLLNANWAMFAVGHFLRPNTASSGAIILILLVFDFNHKVVVGFLAIFLVLIHITV